MENENVESGFTIGQLLVLIKKNLIFIVVVVTLFTVAFGVYGYKIKDTKYTASSVAIVQGESGSVSQSSSYYDYIYSNMLKKTWIELFTINDILEEAREQVVAAGYDDVTVSDIRKIIEVSSNDDSLLLYISVESIDPAFASEVANAVLSSAVNYSQLKDEDGEFVIDTLGDSLRAVNYSAYSSDKVVNITASKNSLLITLIGLILGLIVALMYILIKKFTDSTYHQKEEFENEVGVNVIGFISYCVEEDKKNETVSK